MRVEHIEKSLSLARPAEDPRAIGPDEFLLRWASEPMSRCVEHAFAQSQHVGTIRTGDLQSHASPGDVLLTPVANFEIRDESLCAAYAAQKAKLLRDGPHGLVPGPMLTDGLFDGAIDPGGAAGPLQSDAPLNETILFHGLPASVALEVLYGGLYEHGAATAHIKAFGPGIYFSDSTVDADRFAGDSREARQQGEPGAVLAGHLRLTEAETRHVRFMLVCRVLLGCPATTSEHRLAAPFDQHTSRDPAATAGASADAAGADADEAADAFPPARPIFAPGTRGRRWAPPFSSLVAKDDAPTCDEQCGTVCVMKGIHAARCLPLAIVAYRRVDARADEQILRQIYSGATYERRVTGAFGEQEK